MAMQRRRIIASMVAAAACFHCAGLPSRAAEPVGLACDLHIFGAQRDFSNNKRLAGPFAVRGTWHADARNPLANINIANAVQRADDLDDDRLRALLPKAQKVDVVRHREFVEIGLAKRAKAPVAKKAAACSAELFVMEVYDIEGPTESQGLLVDLIMAPSGQHVTYVWRLFDAEGKLVEERKESVVAPMRLLRSQWTTTDSGAGLDALDEAMDASLEILIKRLSKQRS